MNSAKFWLRILNVHHNEWNVVKRLYIFQFFQGAGIAFFFTSSFAQFLERFPITELPWVMIFSAVLLWGAGFLYTKLEHKLSFERFNWSVILVMATSILILWVFNYTTDQGWFLYLMMAWFNVLYLLNNLQFWGIAALLFDLRQSKRLFAVISAGDIPAKFIGYTLALIFVPYTGTQNLLLLGAGCMIASLPFFNSILKSGPPEVHGYPDHGPKVHEPHRPHQPRKIGTIVKNIATNTYIRRIAFISLFTSTCVILLNYGFYGEVKKAYKNDVELAGFIAFFYASLRIVAFITKMGFTSRLTASLGIKQALFITPVGMVLMVGIIISASWLTADQKIVFYLFGVSSMLVDVLRTSFNSPVLLTLMQPLPTHERLRAHNIVKGIMDPFASLLSGIFLLSLFYMHSRVDLMFLCYVLLVLGGLWIIGVIMVNRQYLGILVKTIGTRYFSREEFDLNDEIILQKLGHKMMTGTDLEVISILRMLSSKIDPVAEDLITRLLQHSSSQVRSEALRLIGNRNLVNTRGHLEEVLQSETDNEVKIQAVKTFCKIAGEDWNLALLLDHPQENVRKAAITGMLVNKLSVIKEKAENLLNGLLHSNSKDDKLIAISIITDVKDEYDHPAHAYLLDDVDPYIRKLAMKAVGKACHPATLAALFKHISSGEKQVITSLLNAGDVIVPHIKKQVLTNGISETLQQDLIVLCGKIGGKKAVTVLLELLKKQPQHAATIIKSLHRCRYAADEDTQKLFEAIAHNFIICGVELLHMQHALSKEDSRYTVLNSSLQIEIQEIRETLLCLFGCMYDREKINQVKFGLNAKHKESVANAMEIIELTVKKDIGRRFNTMFEITGIEERCAALRPLFTEKQFKQVEHILRRILSEKPVQYYNWTKACSLYISKKYFHPLEKDIYVKYVHSDDKLLKETALFASSSS
jgi:ATP:ADP antiporter, AAA family